MRLFHRNIEFERFRRLISSTAVATLATLFLSNSPQRAAAQSGDYAVWQDNFGTSASQSAELVVYNKCGTPVVGSLVFRPGGKESFELEPHNATVVPVPVPLPSGPDVRGHTHLKARVEPGPCTRNGRGLVLLAAAISDSSGMVVHTAGLRSDGELVQAVAESAPERAKRARVDLVRIGTDQTAEIAVVNRCRHDVKFLVRAFAPGGSDGPMTTKAVVPRGKSSVVPLRDVDEGWVEISTRAKQLAGRKASPRRDCSKGDVSSKITVFDLHDGNTGVEVGLLLPIVQSPPG